MRKFLIVVGAIAVLVVAGIVFVNMPSGNNTAPGLNAIAATNTDGTAPKPATNTVPPTTTAATPTTVAQPPAVIGDAYETHLGGAIPLPSDSTYTSLVQLTLPPGNYSLVVAGGISSQATGYARCKLTSTTLPQNGYLQSVAAGGTGVWEAAFTLSSILDAPSGASVAAQCSRPESSAATLFAGNATLVATVVRTLH